MGVHLLVLQPWGCAVGGLPAQSLPEAICEGRTHWLSRETMAPNEHIPPDPRLNCAQIQFNLAAPHFKIPVGSRRQGMGGKAWRG